MEAAGGRLEGARLDDVAANSEERLVDFPDDVGARQYEVIVAPFECLSAEIFGGKIVTLDVRPHRAVVDQHAAVQFIQIA